MSHVTFVEFLLQMLLKADPLRQREGLSTFKTRDSGRYTNLAALRSGCPHLHPESRPLGFVTGVLLFAGLIACAIAELVNHHDGH